MQKGTKLTFFTLLLKATIDGKDIEYSNYNAAVYRAPGALEIFGFNSTIINSDDGITLYVNNNGNGGNLPVIVATNTDTAEVFRTEQNKYSNPTSQVSHCSNQE